MSLSKLNATQNYRSCRRFIVIFAGADSEKLEF